MARKGVIRKHAHLKVDTPTVSRQKIVEHTIAILAKEGPENLSAFLVAKRAGVRRSNVVYYYPHKRDLLVAAVAEVLAKGQAIVIEAVAGKTRPEECLDAYVEALFQWLVRHPEHAGIMGMLHYYGTLGGELQVLNEKVREVGEARIADILHLGKSGSPSRHERTLARLIRELLIGNLTNLLSVNVAPEALRISCELVKKTARNLMENFIGEPA